MAIRVVAQFAQISYSLVLFSYYEFYKNLDISFHKNFPVPTGKDLFC